MCEFDILYGNIIELFLLAESDSAYKKYNKNFKAPSVDEMIQDLHSFNCIDIYVSCTSFFNKIYSFKYSAIDLNDISIKYLKDSISDIPVKLKYNYYFGISTYRKDIDGERYPVREVGINIPSDKFLDFRYRLLQTKTNVVDNYYN